LHYRPTDHQRQSSYLVEKLKIDPEPMSAGGDT